ncbi:MAG: hypothetical protein H0W83_05695 [Planctomycetes bacterium]|nr:hypothetical protein [Planctomycetota bacterium]
MSHLTAADPAAIAERARATPNRGRTHLFLGDPLSDGCDKTTVEPGNGFSPGVWTCGVSLWVAVGESLSTPDLLPPDEIAWELAPPVVASRWRAGPVAVSSRLAHLGGEGSEGVDFCEWTFAAERTVDASVAVVVRDVGPAGAKIAELRWNQAEGTLTVNGSLRIVVEDPAIVCLIVPADDHHDAPIVVLYRELRIAPSAGSRLAVRAEHGFADRAFGTAIPSTARHAGIAAHEGIDRANRTWSDQLSARIFAPDARIAHTWEHCAHHILSAMECGLPRIGAVNYPVLWMRDAVIVLRALDMLGRHDLARIGNDYLAPLIFSGGFGAESDAPGEGIWSLVSHALITRDRAWLARVFPHISARIDWLERMLSATAPIRALTENRTPAYVMSPGSSIVCLPAVNGLVHGRMDWHSPDFYINCWTSCGFRLAAQAAGLVGEPSLAHAWSATALRLDDLIATHLLPAYGNGRDPAVAPYPTGALAGHRPALADRFASWYATNRLDAAGARIAEPLWTYFEAAQIHNALLVGRCDEAWTCLDGMLGDQPHGWDVHAFVEGSPTGTEMLPFRNGDERRGWLSSDAAGGNMPHNWTTAEMVTCLRDLFVVEEGDALVLGCGVPRAWMIPGSSFGVTALPTSLGTISYTVTVDASGTVAVDYRGDAPYRLALPS